MRWVFGYGSLLIPEGINGRGMQHVYSEEDIFEVVLKGFHREWNAVTWNSRFLGLSSDPNTVVNGVVFRIHSEEDYLAFLQSECSSLSNPNPVYTLLDVTHNIFPSSDYRAYFAFTHSLSPEDIIYTCVTNKPSTEGSISQTYKDLIMRALVQRGHDFANEFLNNTGEWI
jgi:hypothetical protein